MLYLITILGKTFFIDESYIDDNNATDDSVASILYILNIWLQFTDELIVCYIFYLYLKPANFVSIVESSEV